MKILKHKLVLAFVSSIALVFLIIGFFIGQIYKNQYILAINDQFAKESKLFADYISESGGIDAVNYSELTRASNLLDARILLLNKEGEVVFDTRNKVDNVQENLIREITNDIESKSEGHFESDSVEEYIYYWNNIEIDGERVGTVIVGNEIKNLNIPYERIWVLLFISFSIAFILILFIGSKIMNRFTNPVEKATEAAIELAKGNYRTRIYEDQAGEFQTLSTSINILARNLQKITKDHEMQRERLLTLIENMGSGLILIDDKGYVTLTNRTYIELFDKSTKEEVQGKSFLDVIDSDEIIDVINDVFMTVQKVKRQVTVPIGIYMKSFDVFGVPIISGKNEWKGIVVVFHDITELKKLEKVRKDFVANVSHELKTPVTSIKGFAETLLDGALNDPEALQTFLEIIYKESDRLQTIISDLLELSKIEDEGFTLNVSKVDVHQLLQEICKVLQNRAESKDISLQIDQSRSLIVEGDEMRMKQIFVNLIANAINYTPPGGQVQIRFEEEADWVKVTVQDTGIGIEKTEIPRIFERFYRVDKDRSRNSGGTGLGLAIVKHLVEAHHGSIVVDSEIGKGSSFHVFFHKSLKDIL